jgi:hypothetical protein
VSSPAPALAKPNTRTVAVRLADVAVLVSSLSLVFGLLLVFFPISFPLIVLHLWQDGHLLVAMMGLALSLDAYLYLRVAHKLSAKPTVLGAACLGSMPIMVVVVLSFVLQGAIAETLAGGLPNLQDRIINEVLAHTYLGLVSAVFLPFLTIRLLQPGPASNSESKSLAPL